MPRRPNSERCVAHRSGLEKSRQRRRGMAANRASGSSERIDSRKKICRGGRTPNDALLIVQAWKNRGNEDAAWQRIERAEVANALIRAKKYAEAAELRTMRCSSFRLGKIAATKTRHGSE